MSAKQRSNRVYKGASRRAQKEAQIVFKKKYQKERKIGAYSEYNSGFLFQVSLLIRKQLTDRARDFNIILDDVAITELSFGKEYAAAVESKQVAQQEAQRAAFVVDKARQERQQKIVAAEGEAAAATMLGEGLSKNPGYLKIRKLNASKNISRSVSRANLTISTDSKIDEIDKRDYRKVPN